MDRQLPGSHADLGDYCHSLHCHSGRGSYIYISIVGGTATGIAIWGEVATGILIVGKAATGILIVGKAATGIAKVQVGQLQVLP